MARAGHRESLRLPPLTLQAATHGQLVLSAHSYDQLCSDTDIEPRLEGKKTEEGLYRLDHIRETAKRQLSRTSHTLIPFLLTSSPFLFPPTPMRSLASPII